MTILSYSNDLQFEDHAHIFSKCQRSKRFWSSLNLEPDHLAQLVSIEGLLARAPTPPKMALAPAFLVEWLL